MKEFITAFLLKRHSLIASLFFIFSWPLLAHGADTDWATNLYWEGTIATSGTTNYTGRLYYTRLDGGGVTITGISFDSTPADGCTITIPETVGNNAATDSVFVVNRPGRFSGVSIDSKNWRNTPLRWQNAPNSFTLSLPGTLRKLCPLIQAANYNDNDTWVTTMTVPDMAMTKLIIRDNNNAHPAARLRIDDYAFYNATTDKGFTALTSVSFGNESVSYIGQHSFRGCPITSISQLPEGLKTIEGYAFFNLYVVKDLILPSTLEKIGDFAFGNILDKVTASYGWFFHNQLTIPASMKYIGTGAFCGSRMVRMKVDIPEGVEYIGGMALGNTLISSLVIPSTVKTIMGGAFRENRMLETVVFKPNTVLTSIGNNLFANSMQLRYIDMSAVNSPSLKSFTVTRGGGSPFYALTPYTMVYLPQSATSVTIGPNEVNFVKYGTDGRWTCPNFVVYDYSYWYDRNNFHYSSFLQPSTVITSPHLALNSMTPEEKQAVADWKNSLQATRGCDYELPHAFTALSARYVRKKSLYGVRTLQPGSVITVSLPYSTTVEDKHFRAYKLVSEMDLANSRHNKGLWFLSLDDSRLSHSALTTEEQKECLTANHPYVLKVLSMPEDSTFKDGYYDEKFQKYFASTNVYVPATPSGYTEVGPADGSTEWTFAGTSLNISNAQASADQLYVLAAGVWCPVLTKDTYAFVHSMRGAMRYKGTGTNNAKSFPKVLEANEPLSSETTGVEAPHFASTPVATPIYSLDGKYLGTSLSALPHGIYVVKGQKICK